MRVALAVALMVGTFMAFLSSLQAQEMRGRASYYAHDHHGRKTASGERFNMRAMTAAHRSLPFGTRLRVCTARRCVHVTVNDRGPAKWTGKVIDLSYGAAQAIGMVGQGVATVSMTIIR